MRRRDGFDALSPKDTASTVLGRTADGDLVAEAKRPAADVWLVRIDPDAAKTLAGQVARHHLDESDGRGDVWQVPHPHAEPLVAALASDDSESAVLALVADVIRTTNSN